MTPLDTLSVSQVEQADHAQTGGCLRRWWFERVQGFRPEQTGAQTEGELGHELLARYLETGQRPPPRVKLSKAVNAAIDRGKLPPPGSGLIERRFSDQPKRDAAGNWIPLDRTKTLHLGGIPFDGFIDYQSRELDADGYLLVLDHKFTSDLQYARPAEKLIKTVQMPVYCLDVWRRFRFQTVQGFRIAHHYVCRRGTSSTMRRAFVTPDQVLERRDKILPVIERMKGVVSTGKQNDVPHNLKSCSAYTGCPHQVRCRAFAGKEQHMSAVGDLDAIFDGPSAQEVAAYSLPSDPPAAPGVVQEATPSLYAPASSTPVEKLKIVYEPDQKDETGGSPPKTLEPPKASAPPAGEKASCADCGTVLHEENSSRLKGGNLVHVKCPAQAPPAEMEKKPRGRPPGSKNKPKETEANAPDITPPPAAVSATLPVENSRAEMLAAPDGGLPETPTAFAERAEGVSQRHDEAQNAVAARQTMGLTAIPSSIPSSIALNVTVDVGPILGALIRKLTGV